MSDANVRIEGELKEQVRALLGGANPTPKRMAELLEELAQSRAIFGTAPPTATVNPGAYAEAEGGVVHGEPPATVNDEIVDAPTQHVPVEPMRAHEPEPHQGHSLIAALQEQNRMFLEEFRAMRREIATLASVKPMTAEEAIQAGKLPPPGIEAPPTGFTGPASWPIGEWFDSPLGPKVKMKICADCGRGTQHHWYCCICGSGPHHYQVTCRDHHDAQRNPLYIKNHFAPGGVWGISHNACSPMCHMQYLAYIGVIPGQNESEPPGLRTFPGNAAQPELARRAGDSD